MRNTFAGPCYICGERVEPGDGWVKHATPAMLAKLKLDRSWAPWLIHHHSCGIKWRGTFHSVNNDEPQKHFD